MFSFLLKRRNKAVIRERKDHNISRKNIAPEALRVLYRLHDAGNAAYLVGGGVRDLLLGRKPKDFDVGTDARPEEVKRLFRRCFLVGRRFRLAHVVWGNKTIETVTFRKAPNPDEVDDESGLYQTNDNTFGTPEDDAYRRDFTINGLFYDIATFRVIDYVGGLKDLERKVVRSIGNPNIRFQEDPVRMMRAVRFAAKLDFEIDSGDMRAIARHRAQIRKASIPRLCEEIFRLFVDGRTERCFRLLYKTGLLGELLPQLQEYLQKSGGERSHLWLALKGLDQVQDSPNLTNAVRLAALYYQLYLELLERPSDKPKRLRRRQEAYQLLEPSAHYYRMPKSAWQRAATMLEQLHRLKQSPNPKDAQTQRLMHSRNFPELCTLAEALRYLPHGFKIETIQAWRALQPQEQTQELPEEEEATSERKFYRRRRRRPRKRRDKEQATSAAESAG